MRGGVVYTDWEYFALWTRYRLNRREVDDMPEWFVRHCLSVAP